MNDVVSRCNLIMIERKLASTVENKLNALILNKAFAVGRTAITFSFSVVVSRTIITG